jgi:hypothetical protein
MVDHIHTPEVTSESSRRFAYHCKECGEFVGFEDKPPVYSVFVNGWEGSMRVWYAPSFDTEEEAEAWIRKQGEWDEGRPYVDEVYNY